MTGRAMAGARDTLRDLVENTIGDALGEFLLERQRNASALMLAERLGAIMNHSASPVRDGLIEHLTGLDQQFAEAVKRSMFTFADIESRVDRADVAKVVRAVDSEVLVKALAGDDAVVESVRSFILSSISNRMSEMIRDEIKEAGSVKRRDADKAQTEVIQAVIALRAAGEIEFVKDDEE